MKAVYLIGNGFDIACGLDTSAASIIRQYKLQLESDISKIQDDGNSKRQALNRFYQSIDNDPESWSDFEMKLSQITSDFENLLNPVQQYYDAFSHFREFLRNHLNEQSSLVTSLELPQNTVAAFQRKALDFFSSELRPFSREILDSFIGDHRKENWNVDFIVFNYTFFLDRIIDSIANNRLSTTINNRIYSRHLNLPVHVHGSLFDEYGIIVGVDSEQQIESELLRKDPEITDSLIKPNLNRLIELNRDSKAENLISAADLIIIHGMSIGVSDASWWRRIGKWLTNGDSNRMLILSIFDSSFGQECLMRAEKYFRTISKAKEGFIKAAQIPENLKELAKKRILVVVNAMGFNTALNPVIRKIRSTRKANQVLETMETHNESGQ